MVENERGKRTNWRSPEAMNAVRRRILPVTGVWAHSSSAGIVRVACAVSDGKMQIVGRDSVL